MKKKIVLKFDYQESEEAFNTTILEMITEAIADEELSTDDVEILESDDETIIHFKNNKLAQDYANL